MKTLCLMILLFLSSVAVGRAQGQPASQDSGGLTVVQISWSRQVYSSLLDQDDPFKHNREQLEDAQIQERIDRENAARTRNGKTAIFYPGRPTRIDTNVRGAQTAYTYKAKVTNNDTKTIRVIEWDYVFYDSATNKEVGRHPLKNNVKLQPGKSTELSRRTASPPAKVVDINKTGKKIKEQYTERVEIQRIEYDDGSVWERPAR